MHNLYEALELYGKDYEKITKHVGTKDIAIVRNQCFNLHKKLKDSPNSPYAHLIGVLNVKLKRGRRTLNSDVDLKSEKESQVESQQEGEERKSQEPIVINSSTAENHAENHDAKMQICDNKLSSSPCSSLQNDDDEISSDDSLL